jgi:glycogen(starch) synthase
VRILYWTQHYRPYIGGVEILAVHVLPLLRARGHELKVATSHGDLDLPDVEEMDGIEVHRFRFAEALASRDPALVLDVRGRVAALKKAWRPDLVQINLSDASAFFHLRTAGDERTVLAMRVAPEGCRAGDGTVLGSLLERADRVTVSSKAVGEELAALSPSVRPRMHVITDAFPAPDLEPSPLPLNPPRVLCLGRVVEHKGFDLVVDAMRDVPGAELTIAGDGPARAALEEQAAALGGRARFTGWVDPADVAALIDEHTVLCVPSRWHESFGLVPLQGALGARPVIASAVGGLPEAVLDGVTGVVVPPEDPAALAAALRSLLADPATAARLGAAGRERALTEFSLEAHVDAYDNLYAEVAA